MTNAASITATCLSQGQRPFQPEVRLFFWIADLASSVSAPSLRLDGLLALHLPHSGGIYVLYAVILKKALILQLSPRLTSLCTHSSPDFLFTSSVLCVPQPTSQHDRHEKKITPCLDCRSFFSPLPSLIYTSVILALLLLLLSVPAALWPVTLHPCDGAFIRAGVYRFAAPLTKHV